MFKHFIYNWRHTKRCCIFVVTVMNSNYQYSSFHQVCFHNPRGTDTGRIRARWCTVRFCTLGPGGKNTHPRLWDEEEQCYGSRNAILDVSLKIAKYPMNFSYPCNRCCVLAQSRGSRDSCRTPRCFCRCHSRTAVCHTHQYLKYKQKPHLKHSAATFNIFFNRIKCVFLGLCSSPMHIVWSMEALKPLWQRQR